MKNIVFAHSRYKDLQRTASFSEKIGIIHQMIQQDFAGIDRISVALFDSKMNTLKTFVQSAKDLPLRFYDCPLKNARSLVELKTLKKNRLINDMDVFKKGENEHTKKIASNGYQASYSVPFFDNAVFVGVMFFNSYQKNVFKDQDLPKLDLFAQLVNSLVVNKLQSTQMLVGAFRSCLSLVSYKDPETGNHLERMARYARLIARELAKEGHPDLTDEIIENLFLFAPLHDIGKIGIPDSILLKPGKLDEDEWQIMQTHSAKGREIIDEIAQHLGLESFDHINLLQNISGSHHETIDGKGYPNRLSKDDIPIETQIVSVADIFDALTSRRSYKPAWSNEAAFRELEHLAGTKLNPDCVRVLIRNKQAVQDIQNRFSDDFDA
ncbi:MAG: HD domain-containing protein [Desulfobacteraceae bacterium]|nr:HD domain-containing protein [Desulfobacteraceae bacterium]